MPSAFEVKPIGGTNYHIGRLPAEVGSWLLNRFVNSLLEQFAEASSAHPEVSEKNLADLTEAQQLAMRDAVASSAVRSMLTKLSQSDYADVMRHCLKVCAREEADMPQPTPVLMENGTFAIRELQYDSIVTLALVTRTLVFNLGPIFAAGQSSNL